MNILHLSDIHFGRDNPEYGIKEPFKNHDIILKELIECVENLDEMSKPEHIVFTGDIAWHGQAEEFAEAYEWFSKLLKALNLTGRDISFCVGNHDVDWAYRCVDKNIDDDSISDISDIYKYENVTKLEPSIYAYNNFCKHIGMIPYAYPLENKRHYSYSVGYKDVGFECGRKVRFVALNSAMLIAQPHISEDKMWLGQEQIKTLVEYGILPPEDDDNVAYTVVLYHHSDRFLHPNETSAYDGRCATLPLIQNYADLLLCGHTESTGRPRLVKQLGGGTLLSGGACYYNDDHYNAFSLIYLSEGKKGIAFFPFYYENGWKDYDFMEHTLFKGKLYKLEEDNRNIKNAVLKIYYGDSSLELPIGIIDLLYDNYGKPNTDRYDNHDNCNDCLKCNASGSVAFDKRDDYDSPKLIGFDNSADFMNYYHIYCNKEAGSHDVNNAVLNIELSKDWNNFLEAIEKYDKMISTVREWSRKNNSKDGAFGEASPECTSYSSATADDMINDTINDTINDDIFWTLYDSNGCKIISGKGMPGFKPINYDMELVKKLRMMEFYFGVKFHIPSELSNLEKRKIDVLMDFIEKDYTDKVDASYEIFEEVSLENMKILYDKVVDDDQVYVRCRAKYKVDLFNVVLNIGEVYAIAGPYFVDKTDLKKKIDTYCDGDRRFVKFVGTEYLHNYVISKYQRFEKEQSEELLDDIFDVNPFDFRLEI